MEGLYCSSQAIRNYAEQFNESQKSDTTLENVDVPSNSTTFGDSFTKTLQEMNTFQPRPMKITRILHDHDPTVCAAYIRSEERGQTSASRGSLLEPPMPISYVGVWKLPTLTKPDTSRPFRKRFDCPAQRKLRCAQDRKVVSDSIFQCISHLLDAHTILTLSDDDIDEAIVDIMKTRVKFLFRAQEKERTVCERNGNIGRVWVKFLEMFDPDWR